MRCDLAQNLSTPMFQLNEHDKSAKFRVTESCCEESIFMVNGIMNHIVATWRSYAPDMVKLQLFQK